MFYLWHLDANRIPGLGVSRRDLSCVELENMKRRINTVCNESVSPHAELLNIYRMILALLNLQERAARFPHMAEEAPLPTLTYTKKELQEISRKIPINLLKSGWQEME